MRLFLLQNGSLNLVRNLSPDLLITVRINLLCCEIPVMSNDNHRIKMIKINIMSLELVVHSTLWSGYFANGNNHFFVKFPLYNVFLRSLMTVGTQAINNIQADTSTQSRI